MLQQFMLLLLYNTSSTCRIISCIPGSFLFFYFVKWKGEEKRRTWRECGLYCTLISRSLEEVSR